jgi:hypothetical protein
LSQTCPRSTDALADAAAHVVEQVVEQALDALAAAQHPLGRARQVLLHAAGQHQAVGRGDDGGERRAQLVAQHAEEQVAHVRRFGREMQDRLGQRLVHRFVEAHQLEHLVAPQPRPALEPEPDHRGAQRAVFGGGLVDVEAGRGTQSSVDLGGGGRLAVEARSAPARLLARFPACLRLLHVERDRGQHLGRVIAQRGAVHLGRSRQHRRGERLALGQDRLLVGRDEFGKAHAT